ncbi:MAG: BlaI/MecI/CopY family transcriptional regulator [Erysipelotrichaceae bacterium]
MDFPTKSEQILLEVLWASKRPLSTAEIIEKVQSDCSRSTMRVRLFQLSKKGLVQSVKQGRQYFYTPINKVEYYQGFINHQVQKKMDVSFNELLLQYFGKEVTHENIQVLQKKIATI